MDVPAGSQRLEAGPAVVCIGSGEAAGIWDDYSEHTAVGEAPSAFIEEPRRFLLMGQVLEIVLDVDARASAVADRKIAPAVGADRHSLEGKQVEIDPACQAERTASDIEVNVLPATNLRARSRETAG